MLVREEREPDYTDSHPAFKVVLSVAGTPGATDCSFGNTV